MDKSKLHKKHREIFEQVMTSKLIPEESKQHIYDVWVELNKHPEKEWVSGTIQEKIAEIAETKVE
jgi:hypothetical protein